MFVFVCICIYAQACGFSSSHFSNVMKYLSKIILGQFKHSNLQFPASISVVSYDLF